MKTVNFRVVHRILLVSSLNEAGKDGANLSFLKNCLEILKKVEIGEEERLDLNMVTENGQIKWSPEKDVEKEFEFTDEQVDLIRGIIKKQDEAKVFNFQTLSPMLELVDKLGIDI